MEKASELIYIDIYIHEEAGPLPMAKKPSDGMIKSHDISNRETQGDSSSYSTLSALGPVVAMRILFPSDYYASALRS
jgi:hypothetical protein